jgi:hypothetical protein
MKAKEQLKVKLQLIRRLSDPDIIIEDLTIRNEIGPVKEIQDPSDPGWGTFNKALTGRTTYMLTVFKEDKIKS